MAVWLVGIVLLFILSFSQLKDYMQSGTKYSENYSLKSTTTDTLYLKSADNINFDWHEKNFDMDRIKIIVKDDEQMVIGEPILDIERSYSDNFEVVLKKKARGRSHDKAVENAGSIKYEWHQNNSEVIFDQYFTLEEGSKWRNQRLQITVKVPEGKVVYLDDSMEKIIHDIENVSNTWDSDMLNHKWIMKKNGLTRVE